MAKVKTEKFEINTRELWSRLEIHRQYDKWINHKINKYGLKENIDYIKITLNSINKNDGRPKTDYLITKEIALNLCRYTRNNDNINDVIQYFDLDIEKEIVVQEAPRLEYQFGEMLKVITGQNWLEQYPIPNENNGFYRLDFYLPKTLIVEYDEEHHKYQNEYYLKRIDYCREWLNKNGEFETYEEKWRLPVIRIKKGKELEGIHRIMELLMCFGCYSECIDWKNVVDISNCKM
jgi:phage anti-repressor protein/very-short-patch-repair endonuclease